LPAHEAWRIPGEALFTRVRGRSILRSSHQVLAAGIMQTRGKARARRTPYMSIFPTKVLLATDGSEEADLAARTAAELADKTGSESHMVHVFGIIPWYPTYPAGFGFGGVELEDPVLEEDLQRTSEQRARELLDAEVEKLRSSGVTPAQAHLAEGGAPQEIVRLAEEIGAGLIVMGSRGGGGIRRALMGSVSDSVVRHAHCPVMVVRQEEEQAV
jgi:nucleotide-binding universal stress UspA family protein